MPRKVREVSLTTRTARSGLPSRVKPYYRRLGHDLHVGYYRPSTPSRPGTWIARRYLKAMRYETQALGSADDDSREPADGKTVLTFDQAQAAARAWAVRRMATEQATATAESTPTVRKAVQIYIAARMARSMKTGRDAELRLTHHVLAAPMAGVALVNLSDRDLSAWRDGLQRGGRGVKADAPPLAPATLARLLNDLRAALTAAARKVRAGAETLAVIKDGLRAPEAPDRARPRQVLTDADVRRLVEASAAQDDDFGALVLVLAATGARLDQVARITVADFQHDQRRVMVPTSRKGRGIKQVTHTAVPLADDVVARLRSLAAGRAGHEVLLMRWHHRQVTGEPASGTVPQWERENRRPWQSSSELTRPWRVAVKTVGLSADVVPYALRHSSIVRGLRAGLPVRLVAAAHDTSSAMIEKHYAAFVVDMTEDLLRRAVVPLMPAIVRALRA